MKHLKKIRGKLNWKFVSNNLKNKKIVNTEKLVKSDLKK